MLFALALEPFVAFYFFDPNQPNKCYGQDQHCQVVLGGEGSQGA